MAQTYFQRGETLDLTLPYNSTPGQGVMVGNLFGVLTSTDFYTDGGTAQSGTANAVQNVGVWLVSKDSSTFSQGDNVYWNDAGRVVTSNSAYPVVGKATAAAATGDAGVYVLLVNNFGTTNPNGSQVGVLAITSAQIKTLNSVGLQLLAAPGAGKVTIIERLVFEMIPSGTAYTSGGALNAYWAGGSAIFSGSIPATVVTASGTTKSITTLSAKTETNGVTESVNTAINLQAATGDFATGTGTAYVWFVYRTLTLA